MEVVIKFALNQLPVLGELSGTTSVKFEHCQFIKKEPLEIDLTDRVKVCYELDKYGVMDRRVLTKRGRATHKGELRDWTTIGLL